MSQKDRQKVVDRIKSDKEVRIILMSFKAGGVGELLPSGRSVRNSDAKIGLNLTACNNVILVDLWWNPALEVSHVISPPPSSLRVDLTTLLGSSVWTGTPHWTEKAGEHMEADDRGHGGGTDPTCTCFATPARAWCLCLGQLQEQKRELAESALSGDARSKVGTLGMDELMDLFKPSYDYEEDGDDDDD